MDFTNFLFWGLFLPVVFLLYILCPRKAKNLALLAGSAAFYCFYNFISVRSYRVILKYAVFLCASILITYFGGRLGNRYLAQGKMRKGKTALITALCLNLSILLVCKYTNFAVSIINDVNRLLGIWQGNIAVPNLLLPVGLSFFIFQSSTYVLDLYYGKTTEEAGFLDYTLFVSFFPTFISGPIQRSAHFLPQIKMERTISWERIQYFFATFLWGAFLKLVVANRLSVFTDAVYQDIGRRGFLLLLLAAIAYSVQIYADFSGYSYMAIAVAKLFGFDFSENFMHPYAATTIADFWRRWHISLTSWFRDYLYIPLGGNRKGRLAKYRNILIVFLISGLWHGPSWNFVLWGGIHAAYQIIGDATKPYRLSVCRSLGIDRDSFAFRLWQRVFVFFAVTFAWVFFRLPSLNSVCMFFAAISRDWEIACLFTGVPAALGLNTITVAAVILMTGIYCLKESGMTLQWFFSQSMILRFLCYYILILCTILFGEYGPDFSANSFIYAGF